MLTGKKRGFFDDAEDDDDSEAIDKESRKVQEKGGPLIRKVLRWDRGRRGGRRRRS